MERLVEHIQELHREEEQAYLAGDYETMQLVSDTLDHIVTDEAVDAMKGEA